MAAEPVVTARTTARAAGWSGISTIVLRLGGLAVGVVIARILTPEQFGVYAVALTVQSILMTVADLGLSAELIKSSDPERKAPTVATLGLVIGALLTLGTVITASTVADLLGSPAAAPAIMVLAFTLLLGGAGVVPYAYLQRRFQQRELFLVSVVDFVISTGVTLVLIAAGWGVLGLAVGRLTAQTASTTLQFVLAKTPPRFRIDRQVVRPVLAFGLPIAGANLLSWALLNVDNVVIARIAGPTALGFYVLAFNISNWPMNALSQMVRSVSLPYFARVDDRAPDAVPRLVAVAWAGALPAGALLAVLSASVIQFVYGAKWLPAAPVLAALGIFGGLRVVFDIFAGFLYARGRSRPVLWVQLVWFVAIVIGMIVATRAYGIVGAGWVHVVVAVVVILPAYVVALKAAGVRLASIVREAWLPTVAAGVASVAAALVAYALDGALLKLIAGGLAAGIVYLALMGRWIASGLRALRRGPIDDAGDVTLITTELEQPNPASDDRTADDQTTDDQTTDDQPVRKSA
ncbi:lipopolysaccharide biosynthesis protein [Microlunatus sp. Gsoil 973]|uniref:lipopolysaccharide biosynthesis protein n=1 Tax=Microlunatus sp. Gsoil 973 TaxID=2672569 RepID=UPI0018A8520B|nr:lipopolysaccharide biosynthesis protein [Microlunatus sp. Gsoil 973]